MISLPTADRYCHGLAQPAARQVFCADFERRYAAPLARCRRRGTVRVCAADRNWSR
jgi:hypothetical protein